MYDKSLETLEYNKILGIISILADSAAGKDSVMAVRPLTDADEITKKLDLIKDIDFALSNVKGFGLREVSTLTEILKKRHISGITLEMEEIIRIKNNLQAAHGLKKKVKDIKDEIPILGEFLSGIPELDYLLSSIKMIFNDQNQVKDDASFKLKEIRTSIASIRNRVQKTLENSLTDDRYKDVLQDDIITLRSGRYVLMVKSDFKGAMKGIIHDSSNTGQSVFIEPMPVVEMNNKMAKLEQEEKIEINRILRELTWTLLEYHKDLSELTELLIKLDELQASARFSAVSEGTYPRITGENKIKLEEGRHPLLDERLADLRAKYFETDSASSAKVVPISITLEDREMGMVISGPNMGGKTVSLKTLGLLSLMALSGFPVPAREFVLPLFRQVAADIGDKQEITKALSTFSSHLTSIKEAIEGLELPSLILLDEIGTGTDPEEGSALARSILDYFIEKKCFTVITTHSNYLKTYSYTTKGLKSASVEFDAETGKPTYKLVEGSPGSSKAFSMAQSLGFPDEILENAKTHLEAGHQYMEDFISKLEKDRIRFAEKYDEYKLKAEDLEKELNNAVRERKKLEQQSREFAVKVKGEMADLVAKYRKKIDKIIDKTTDRAEQLELKRLSSEQMNEMQSSLEEEKLLQPLKNIKTGTELPPSLKNGDKLKLRFGSGPATLKRDWNKDKDKKLYVEYDGKSLEVSPKDVLEVIIEDKEKSEGETMYSGYHLEKKSRATREINIIGHTVDEVDLMLGKFLDDAMLAGLTEVRVVHGMGKGILKRRVKQYLKTHPLVKSFTTAPQNRGGEGATEIELK